MPHYASIILSPLIFTTLLSSVLCSQSPLFPQYHEFYTSTANRILFSINHRSRMIEFCSSNDTATDYCLLNAMDDGLFDIWNSSVQNSTLKMDVSTPGDLTDTILKSLLTRDDLMEVVHSESVSMDCLADIYYFAESLQKMVAWALKGADSFGKPPAGLLTGNVIWPGNYDQCREVQAPAVDVTFHIGPVKYVHQAEFNGQYCFVSIVSKTSPPPPVPEGYLLEGLTIGLCTSSRCTDRMMTSMAIDVQKIFNKTLSKLGLQVAGITCPSKMDHLDGPGIIGMIVLVTLLTLALSATLYECCILRWLAFKRNKNILDDVDVATSDQNGDSVMTADDTSLTIDSTLDAKSTFTRFVTCFSLVTNARKLFASSSTSQSSTFALLGQQAGFANLESPDLRCLHGMRFLSMAWIILGNTYYMSFALTANPLDRLDPDKYDFWFQSILQAAYACDTFFLISACLVAIQFFTVADRFPQVIGTCRFWFQFYFQRWLRLTPPYMLILCVYVGLWKYVGEGPFWPRDGFEVDNCRRTWWSNLLYINNYLDIQFEQHGGTVTGREYCAAWTWYLANDMQLYLISPLVLYPIFKVRERKRWLWIGYGILTTLIIAGLAVTGIIARVNELPPNMFPADLNLRDKAQFMRDELYFKPYPHLPCYALGLILALALRRYRQQNHQGLKKITVFIGWSMSLSFAMMVIFGLWPNYRGRPFAVDLSAAYAATSRFVFTAAVAWVAFACSTGSGGVVNKFLSWSLFVPLSRLTFCAYLIHPMILYAYYFSRRTTFYYTDFVMVWFFGAFLFFSYLASIAVALVFESPFLMLNRRFVKRSE